MYEFHIKPIAIKNSKEKVIENVKYYVYCYPKKLVLYCQSEYGLTETVIDLSKVQYVACYKNNQFMRCFNG